MKKKSTKKSAPPNKPTLVVFLLDRSGSMSACKEQTITGFNGYLKEMRNSDKTDQIRFTLTQFDTMGIDIVHDAVPLKDVNNLTTETYKPRDGTPLYDAIGKTIRETEKKAGNKYKVLFVTLTDGQENSSREWNSTTIKHLIHEKENVDHWTFAYIGVGLDGFAATQTIAAGTIGASNVLRTSSKNTGRAYSRLATASVCYMSSTTSADSCAQNVFGKNATTEDEQ